MQLHIRRIGNSQGIILPRPLLHQVGIESEVNVEVIDGAIMLRPTKQHPRAGWDEAFTKAIGAGHEPDTELFEGITNEFDESDWQW